MVTTTLDATIPEDVSRADAAAAVTRRYGYWSAGAGIIPMPVIDLVLIGGVQVKMVYELTKIYEIPFSETRVKALIGALVGTLAPFGAASMVVGGVSSMMKAIPVVGSLATLTIGPALAFASTYAVGRVFSKHFAEGGTLLNFSAEKATPEFKREFEAARNAKPTDDVVAEDAKKQK